MDDYLEAPKSAKIWAFFLAMIFAWLNGGVFVLGYAERSVSCGRQVKPCICCVGLAV
jgi:hypothetical protein